MNRKLGLSAPWDECARKATALFEGDDEVTIVADYRNPDDRKIKFYVNNAAKADALGKLLPPEYKFGNVVVKIEIDPGNAAESPATIAKAAFAGNPNVAGIVEGVVGPNPVVFAEFNPDVVQYWNDNLGNPAGIQTALMEDIAKSVLRADCGIVFTTAAKEVVS